MPGTSSQTKAVFVSTKTALGRGAGPWGGVQICTDEYLKVLDKAGFETEIIEFDWDHRLLNRIQRRLRRRPYRHMLPPDLAPKVLSAITNSGADIAFLNSGYLAPLAKTIHEAFDGKTKTVLLSNGFGCADILHEIRYRSRASDKISARASDLKWLAGHLVEEAEQRRYIDHVFCLSEFDLDLERWVGARSVSWLPRTVVARPIRWNPTANRIGFVGTLDHTPNAEGLVLFLKALEQKANGIPAVRVVGGPEKVGAELARRFRRVEYLGHISDRELEAEVSTWSCAVHPLFCYSAGCSTKLATMLGWGLPVVTTPAGCRGYLWREGNIPLAEDPVGVATIACEMLEEGKRALAQAEIARVRESSPTIDDVSEIVKSKISEVRRH